MEINLPSYDFLNMKKDESKKCLDKVIEVDQNVHQVDKDSRSKLGHWHVILAGLMKWRLEVICQMKCIDDQLKMDRSRDIAD